MARENLLYGRYNSKLDKSLSKDYTGTTFPLRFLDKTTMILGGIYGVVVLIIVFVSIPEPINSDSLHQTTSLADITQINPEPQLNLADLFAKSDDGVVQIIVRKSGDNSSDRTIGSGIVYDLQGHIITNNHVVVDYQKVRAVFHGGESYPAKVVGTDPYADLAVIKVDVDPKLLHPLQLGDSSKLRIGDQVVAIGSPFGLSGSMTSGIVSQVGRLLTPPNLESFSIPNVIQTDTAINPGNSGGPLLDNRGEVVGINAAIQSSTGEFSGIGFAIPSNTMKRVIPDLILHGHYRHPWLGIAGMTIDPDIASALGTPVERGFLVENVVPNSPASKGGLHGSNNTRTVDGTKYKVGGDIIVGADNIMVNQLEDILNYLQDQKSVGDKMTLKIIRDGKPMQINLILEERPSQAQ